MSPDDALMAVQVEAAQTWMGSTPERLFANPNLNIPGLWLTGRISPDGRRFLILKLVSNEEHRPTACSSSSCRIGWKN